MVNAKESKVVKLMKSTIALSPDIEALTLVSTDGLPIESVLPTDMEEDRVAAMGAALLSLGERAAEELERGRLEQVVVRAEKGDVILTSVGEDALLLTLMSKEAKLGMIFMALKRLVKELKKII
jgi:predicted regulator of Ras-like GTPase activity (Roadblock/LC7/MglB family)